jgi:hypothetical protein
MPVPAKGRKKLGCAGAMTGGKAAGTNRQCRVSKRKYEILLRLDRLWQCNLNADAIPIGDLGYCFTLPVEERYARFTGLCLRRISMD